jgi:iron complex transport system substrate-binding protein
MSRNPGSPGLLRFSLLVTLFAFGCGQSQQPAGHATDSNSTNIDRPAAGDTVLKYAHGFRIDNRNGYREVSILNRAAGRIDTLRYLLVDEGQTPPAGRPGIPVIHTPVRSMTVLSSIHIGLADFAGAADRITGLGNFQYVNAPIVREHIRTGRIKQVGIDGNTNNELVIAMHPGVVITSTNPDAAYGQYKTLTDAGIPVLPDAEWLETTPLGRAEWAKLFAALIDREAEIGKKFDSVERTYLALAAIGSAAKKKPSVIIAMPWKGVWYTPAGESYMAQFLRDAGADYSWSATKGIGSLALNVEAVIPIALKADFWFNVGYVDSRKEIAEKDSRFADFHSFKTGAVYNFNRRVNDIGSNDYWESGAANPQRVLADLIRILHPDALPQDTLYYYKQLK